MDPHAGFIPHATVVIRSNRIVEVTADPTVASRYAGATEIDASGCAVLPGLVNCHSHLRPMRALGDALDELSWHSYPDRVSPLMTPEDAYVGAANTFLEMLRNGITTTLAMSILDEPELHAAEEIGIRARIARHAENQSLIEGTIAVAESRQPSSEDDRVRMWLGVEMYATDDELAITGAAAQRLGLPVHTHFSEDRVDDVERLALAGLLGPDLVIAHAIQVDEITSRRLAAADVAVAHNPKSNSKYGIGVAPVLRYLELGMRVGLGTDGPMSTYCVDIFEEMRAALLLHRVTSRNAAALTADRALELATIGGASALGLGDQIGRLTPGLKADVIVVDLHAAHFRPLFLEGADANLVPLLAFAATGRDVRDVIVDGRVVIRDKRLQTMDEETVMANCQSAGDRLLAAMASA